MKKWRKISLVIMAMTMLLSSIVVHAEDNYYTDTGKSYSLSYKYGYETRYRTYTQPMGENGMYSKFWDVVFVMVPYGDYYYFYEVLVDINQTTGTYETYTVDRNGVASTPKTSTWTTNKSIICEKTLEDGTTVDFSGYAYLHSQTSWNRYDDIEGINSITGVPYYMFPEQSDYPTSNQDIQNSIREFAVALTCIGSTAHEIYGTTGVGTEEQYVYDKSIGYLQMSDMYGSYNKETDELLRTFPWSDKTTNNFDVTQEGVSVGLYSKFHGYYFTNSGQYLTSSGYGEHISDVPNFYGRVKGSDLQGIFDEMTLHEYYAHEKEKLNELSTAWIAQPIIKYEYWFRVEIYNEETSTWSYGGWTKFADKDISMFEGNNTVQNIDPEGNIDSENSSNKFTEDTEGNFVEVPDSEQDLTDWDSGFDLMDDFVDGIQSLQSGLGSLPTVIGNVFTALPSGIIAAIGVGFILAIVLRILGR